MTKLTQSLGDSKTIAIVGNIAETQLGFRGELIKDLVANGHRVYCLAVDFDEESEQAFRALGGHAIKYRMNPKGMNPFADFLTIVQLTYLFRRLNVDISLCYFLKPALLGTLAAKLAGVPWRVAKIEGLGRIFTNAPNGNSLSRRFVRYFLIIAMKLVLPLANRVLVLNSGDKQDLLGLKIPQTKLFMIGGIGVCLQNYSYCAPNLDVTCFLFAGRLLSEKGIWYFLEAADNIRRRHPNVEFCVVGGLDSGPGAVTKATLQRLVASNVITYAGISSDVVPWLARSSVFVLPTYYREGVPRTSQEALAMGRPIITTRTPGCIETVEDGVNGFLVPIHDQQALEAAMQRFIDNPQLISEMGAHSRKLAEARFDVRKINRNIMDLMGL